ncbi:hypothetical protein BJ944DRAFT_238980 [Cunninghamella echinulata]|nr:hypothetical protein BJ944DRAFT_238980 [Cunninghamella echinulata]
MNLNNLVFLFLVVSGYSIAVSAVYYNVPYCSGGACAFLTSFTNKRICACMSGTRTEEINYDQSGVLKLFSTSDCTGNYQQVYKGQSVKNAMWVNSISFGPAGTSVMDGEGCEAPWSVTKEELIDYANRVGLHDTVTQNLKELEDEKWIYESIESLWENYVTRNGSLFTEAKIVISNC